MRIKDQQTAVDVARKLIGDWNKEHSIAVYTDAHLQLVRAEVLSIGILNSSLVHPREFYKPAIVYNVSSAILLHNHPSTFLTPSPEDVRISKQLRKAGEILGIVFQDSIIFNIKGEYYSLGEHKKL